MGLETVPFHLHKYWKTFLFVKRILLALFSWDCYPYRNHRYQDYRRPSSKTGRKILPYSRRSRKRNEWFCKKPCPAICNQN